MSTYDKIAWLPLCGGLSGLGLILSYLVMRRRGLGSGLRGAAWSLLPLAAYLTGSIEMFWKIGTAIGDFAKGFAFSPKVWSGIALAGLAVVLFVMSGPLRRHRVARSKDTDAVGTADAAKTRQLAPRTAAAPANVPASAPAKTPANVPAKAPVKARKGKAADDDDDLGDIADILRRHGIN